MLKLAMRVPVTSAAILGGSLVLADGMIVATLMVSFVALVLLAAAAEVLGSACSHGQARPSRQPGAMQSATAPAPSPRP